MHFLKTLYEILSSPLLLDQTAINFSEFDKLTTVGLDTFN